ncbi:MAG: TonB-dependent receptor [Pyrinomonadaceae bacterium]|nr:TonB-dependent receptor [Sphingobacteriaceae bacterium]
MNLTTILMLLFSISVSATGFSQNKINLQIKKSAIADVISKIEEQSTYRFLYNQNLGEIKQKVSVTLEDASIDEALKELLKNSGLSYQFINNELIAIQKTPLLQTDITVAGKVTDNTGEALIGVSVKIKGTNKGVSTNLNGEYSLSAPENATLVFSYVGYEALEQKLTGQTRVNVTLIQSVSQLNEVVVVGYGTQRRASLTTAVASVGGEDIAERGTLSPIQGVQGQVAGVDISAGSGRAGAGYNIQIRGQNSLQGGSVLYVVDGVIVNDIAFLNPQDISKMDILKDAAATAIYGSRGSNGVVIVTTKQGSNIKTKGGATISYDAYTGIRDVARMPNFMDGDQWVEYRRNSFIVPSLAAGTAYTANASLFDNPSIINLIANQQYTNWRDLVLQQGTQNNHFLSVSGTSNNDIQYILAAGYQNEKGNIINDKYSRYNFKGSVDHKLNSKWRAGISLNFSLAESERGSDLAVINAFRMAPIFSPYDETGNLAFRPGQIPNPATNVVSSFTSSVNPLLDNANSQTNVRRSFGLGNLYLQYSPLSWLDIKSTFSPRMTFERGGRYFGASTEARGGVSAAAALQNTENFGYIFDNILTAKRTFKEHSFDFTGLFSLQQDRDEMAYARVTNLPFNSSFYNLGTGTRESNLSGFAKSTLTSYMARLNYSFQDKYLLTLATRFDGSSKLAEGHKWASFPSAAIAWRLSEEPFIQKISQISDLKLRVSAGVAGNNNNINPYGTQMTLSNPTYYDFGGTVALGYSPSRLPNPNLTWERTREFNYGLDFGLYKGRISGTVDLYNKLAKEVIMQRDIAFENGYQNITDNVGSVSNKGIELSLRTVNISKKDFSWTTSINFARNKNAIVELLDKKVDLVGNSWFIGQPINANYTYIFDGIWQEDERAAALKYSQVPGQARVKDVDGNFILNNADKAIIGQRDPKWTGGFSTQITYKSFDLSTALFARQGMQISSPFHAEFLNFADRGRTKLNVNYYMSPNSVTPAKVSNEYPQAQNPGPYWAQVGYFKDLSFVKVQNITLGYNLPAKYTQKVKFKNIRLYANVLNPFVWTDYDGFDPEYASGMEPSSSNALNQIPITNGLNNTGTSSITYQFGFNVKF